MNQNWSNIYRYSSEATIAADDKEGPVDWSEDPEENQSWSIFASNILIRQLPYGQTSSYQQTPMQWENLPKIAAASTSASTVSSYAQNQGYQMSQGIYSQGIWRPTMGVLSATPTNSTEQQQSFPIVLGRLEPSARPRELQNMVLPLPNTLKAFPLFALTGKIFLDLELPQRPQIQSGRAFVSSTMNTSFPNRGPLADLN